MVDRNALYRDVADSELGTVVNSDTVRMLSMLHVAVLGELTVQLK